MQGLLPAGWLAFAGRELNPLDHVERFQIIFSSPSPGFFLAQRTVGLHRESDVAQHGPDGKLAVKLRINAFTVALGMEESADADLRMDLVGGDFHLKLGGVAAITLARHVLRVTSGERKIVSHRGRTNARGQSETDAAYKSKTDAAYNWMDSSRYDCPTFSTRDCSRCHAALQCGFQKGGGKLHAEAQPTLLIQPNS